MAASRGPARASGNAAGDDSARVVPAAVELAPIDAERRPDGATASSNTGARPTSTRGAAAYDTASDAAPMSHRRSGRASGAAAGTSSQPGGAHAHTPTVAERLARLRGLPVVLDLVEDRTQSRLFSALVFVLIIGFVLRAGVFVPFLGPPRDTPRSDAVLLRLDASVGAQPASGGRGVASDDAIELSAGVSGTVGAARASGSARAQRFRVGAPLSPAPVLVATTSNAQPAPHVELTVTTEYGEDIDLSVAAHVDDTIWAESGVEHSGAFPLPGIPPRAMLEPRLRGATVLTDSNGRASFTDLTFEVALPAVYVLHFSCANCTQDAVLPVRLSPSVFALEPLVALPDAAASRDRLVAVAGQPLEVQPSFRVTDSSGRPLSGHHVVAVPSGFAIEALRAPMADTEKFLPRFHTLGNATSLASDALGIARFTGLTVQSSSLRSGLLTFVVERVKAASPQAFNVEVDRLRAPSGRLVLTIVAQPPASVVEGDVFPADHQPVVRVTDAASGVPVAGIVVSALMAKEAGTWSHMLYGPPTARSLDVLRDTGSTFSADAVVRNLRHGKRIRGFYSEPSDASGLARFENMGFTANGPAGIFALVFVAFGFRTVVSADILVLTSVAAVDIVEQPAGIAPVGTEWTPRVLEGLGIGGAYGDLGFTATLFPDLPTIVPTGMITAPPLLRLLDGAGQPVPGKPVVVAVRTAPDGAAAGDAVDPVADENEANKFVVREQLRTGIAASDAHGMVRFANEVPNVDDAFTVCLRESEPCSYLRMLIADVPPGATATVQLRFIVDGGGATSAWSAPLTVINTDAAGTSTCAYVDLGDDVAAGAHPAGSAATWPAWQSGPGRTTVGGLVPPMPFRVLNSRGTPVSAKAQADAGAVMNAYGSATAGPWVVLQLDETYSPVDIWVVFERQMMYAAAMGPVVFFGRDPGDPAFLPTLLVTAPLHRTDFDASLQAAQATFEAASPGASANATVDTTEMISTAAVIVAGWPAFYHVQAYVSTPDEAAGLPRVMCPADSTRALPIAARVAEVRVEVPPSGCVTGQPLAHPPVVRAVDADGNGVAGTTAYVLFAIRGDGSLFPSSLNTRYSSAAAFSAVIDAFTGSTSAMPGAALTGVFASEVGVQGANNGWATDADGRAVMSGIVFPDNAVGNFTFIAVVDGVNSEPMDPIACTGPVANIRIAFPDIVSPRRRGVVPPDCWPGHTGAMDACPRVNVTAHGNGTNSSAAGAVQALECSGRGVCLCGGVCACDSGYTRSPDCSVRDDMTVPVPVECGGPTPVVPVRLFNTRENTSPDVVPVPPWLFDPVVVEDARAEPVPGVAVRAVLLGCDGLPAGTKVVFGHPARVVAGGELYTPLLESLPSDGQGVAAWPEVFDPPLVLHAAETGCYMWAYAHGGDSRGNLRLNDLEEPLSGAVFRVGRPFRIVNGVRAVDVLRQPSPVAAAGVPLAVQPAVRVDFDSLDAQKCPALCYTAGAPCSGVQDVGMRILFTQEECEALDCYTQLVPVLVAVGVHLESGRETVLNSAASANSLAAANSHCVRLDHNGTAVFSSLSIPSSILVGIAGVIPLYRPTPPGAWVVRFEVLGFGASHSDVINVVDHPSAIAVLSGLPQTLVVGHPEAPEPVVVGCTVDGETPLPGIHVTASLVPARMATTADAFGDGRDDTYQITPGDMRVEALSYPELVLASALAVTASGGDDGSAGLAPTGVRGAADSARVGEALFNLVAHAGASGVYAVQFSSDGGARLSNVSQPVVHPSATATGDAFWTAFASGPGVGAPAHASSTLPLVRILNPVGGVSVAVAPLSLPLVSVSGSDVELDAIGETVVRRTAPDTEGHPRTVTVVNLIATATVQPPAAVTVCAVDGAGNPVPDALIERHTIIGTDALALQSTGGSPTAATPEAAPLVSVGVLDVATGAAVAAVQRASNETGCIEMRAFAFEDVDTSEGGADFGGGDGDFNFTVVWSVNGVVSGTRLAVRLRALETVHKFSFAALGNLVWVPFLVLAPVLAPNSLFFRREARVLMLLVALIFAVAGVVLGSSVLQAQTDGLASFFPPSSTDWLSAQDQAFTVLMVIAGCWVGVWLVLLPVGWYKQVQAAKAARASVTEAVVASSAGVSRTVGGDAAVVGADAAARAGGGPDVTTQVNPLARTAASHRRSAAPVLQQVPARRLTTAAVAMRRLTALVSVDDVAELEAPTLRGSEGATGAEPGGSATSSAAGAASDRVDTAAWVASGSGTQGAVLGPGSFERKRATQMAYTRAAVGRFTAQLVSDAGQHSIAEGARARVVGAVDALTPAATNALVSSFARLCDIAEALSTSPGTIDLESGRGLPHAQTVAAVARDRAPSEAREGAAEAELALGTGLFSLEELVALPGARRSGASLRYRTLPRGLLVRHLLCVHLGLPADILRGAHDRPFIVTQGMFMRGYERRLRRVGVVHTMRDLASCGIAWHQHGAHASVRNAHAATHSGGPTAGAVPVSSACPWFHAVPKSSSAPAVWEWTDEGRGALSRLWAISRGDAGADNNRTSSGDGRLGVPVGTAGDGSHSGGDGSRRSSAGGGGGGAIGGGGGGSTRPTSSAKRVANRAGATQAAGETVLRHWLGADLDAVVGSAHRVSLSAYLALYARRLCAKDRPRGSSDVSEPIVADALVWQELRAAGFDRRLAAVLLTRVEGSGGEVVATQALHTALTWALQRLSTAGDGKLTRDEVIALLRGASADADKQEVPSSAMFAAAARHECGDGGANDPGAIEPRVGAAGLVAVIGGLGTSEGARSSTGSLDTARDLMQSVLVSEAVGIDRFLLDARGRRERDAALLTVRAADARGASHSLLAQAGEAATIACARALLVVGDAVFGAQSKLAVPAWARPVRHAPDADDVALSRAKPATGLAGIGSGVSITGRGIGRSHDGRARVSAFLYPQRLLIAFAISVVFCIWLTMLVVALSQRAVVAVDDLFHRAERAEGEVLTRVTEIVASQVSSATSQLLASQAASASPAGQVGAASQTFGAFASAGGSGSGASCGESGGGVGGGAASSLGGAAASVSGASGSASALQADALTASPAAGIEAQVQEQVAQSTHALAGDAVSSLLAGSGLARLEQLRDAAKDHLEAAAAWGAAVAFALVMLVWSSIFSQYMRRMMAARAGDYRLMWNRNRLAHATNFIGLQGALSGLAFVLFWAPFATLIFVLQWPQARQVVSDALEQAFLAPAVVTILLQVAQWVTMNVLLVRRNVIQNKRLFLTLDIVFTIANLFTGTVKAIARLAFSLFFFGATFMRCDVSALPAEHEVWDPAAASYNATFMVDIQHSHPLKVAFTELLITHLKRHRRRRALASQSSRLSRDKAEGGTAAARDEAPAGTVQGAPSGDDDCAQRARSRGSRSTRARIRWHLALVMLRNPTLAPLRVRGANDDDDEDGTDDAGAGGRLAGRLAGLGSGLRHRGADIGAGLRKFGRRPARSRHGHGHGGAATESSKRPEE